MGLIAGQPTPCLSRPLGSLKLGHKIITCHCSITGEWVYEEVMIFKIHGYHCERGVCNMTNVNENLLTADHRVRIQLGEAGRNAVWSERWLYAHEMPDTQTTVLDQVTVVNIEIDSPHSILVKCGANTNFLASTLSTPHDEGNGVVGSSFQRDRAVFPSWTHGSTFRFFNKREITGLMSTSSDLPHYLALGEEKLRSSTCLSVASPHRRAGQTRAIYVGTRSAPKGRSRGGPAVP